MARSRSPVKKESTLATKTIIPEEGIPIVDKEEQEQASVENNQYSEENLEEFPQARREEEERVRAEVEARERAEEESKERDRAEAENRARTELEARARAQAQERIRAEAEARARTEVEAARVAAEAARPGKEKAAKAAVDAAREKAAKAAAEVAEAKLRAEEKARAEAKERAAADAAALLSMKAKDAYRARFKHELIKVNGALKSNSISMALESLDHFSKFISETFDNLDRDQKTLIYFDIDRIKTSKQSINFEIIALLENVLSRVPDNDPRKAIGTNLLSNFKKVIGEEYCNEQIRVIKMDVDWANKVMQKQTEILKWMDNKVQKNAEIANEELKHFDPVLAKAASQIEKYREQVVGDFEKHKRDRDNELAKASFIWKKRAELIAKPNLIKELEGYRNKRSKENYWSESRGMTKQIKLEAAEQIINYYSKGIKPTFSPKHIEALQDHRLGGIIKKYENIMFGGSFSGWAKKFTLHPAPPVSSPKYRGG